MAQNEGQHMLQVRFAPLGIIDPNTAAIQPGLQYLYNQKIGFSVEYGFPFRAISLFNLNHDKEDFTYYKIRSELKYFWLGRIAKAVEKKVHPYLALEGFYIPQTYRKENDWFERGDVQFHYETSTIQKDVLGSAAKIGFETRFRSGFVLDVFGGVGIRNVSIRHQASGLRDIGPHMEDEWVRSKDRNERDHIFFHMALGVKIGYTLFALPDRTINN